jgi:hypothetical protein
MANSIRARGPWGFGVEGGERLAVLSEEALKVALTYSISSLKEPGFLSERVKPSEFMSLGLRGVFG